jgi:PAS domain-containing protein
MLSELSGTEELLGTILDAIPASIFMVDKDVEVLGVNRTALRMLSQDPDSIIRHPAGELLHCIHSTETPGGCGTSESCRECQVRAGVSKSFSANQVVRQKVQMELVNKGDVSKVSLLITTTPFEFKEKMFVLLILEDISELMELMDLLPVCAHCKKVMDDSQEQQNVKKHFKEQLKLVATQDLCPECMLKLFMDGENF